MLHRTEHNRTLLLNHIGKLPQHGLSSQISLSALGFRSCTVSLLFQEVMSAVRVNMCTEYVPLYLLRGTFRFGFLPFFLFFFLPPSASSRAESSEIDTSGDSDRFSALIINSFHTV